MRIAQRVLIILAAAVLVMYGVSKIYREKEEKFRKQWENMQTERFMQKLTGPPGLSAEDYVNYTASLNCHGTYPDIRIEEYRKEQDMEGKGYYCLVSWEELKECLYEENHYAFADNSVIRIEIRHRSREGIVKNSYYGIASGKE